MRRKGEIGKRQLARAFPHTITIPVPPMGFGRRRIEALDQAAARIAPGRHGHWPQRWPEATIYGFADPAEAAAFRAWLASSGIDWSAPNDY